MTYEIVDWVIDHQDDFDERGILLREQTLSEALSRHKDKRIRKFLSTSGDKVFDVKSDTTGNSFREEINNNNNQWTQTLITDINKARNEEDLGAIQTTFDSEKELYREESADLISSELESKRQEISEVEREESAAMSILEQARRATTQEDVDELPSRTFVERRYGRRVAEQFSDIRSGVLSRLKSLEEETEERISAEIEEAETLEALRRIDVTQAPTTISEERLRRRLENKMGELE